MKSGCIMGNVGHFDNEISKVALDKLAKGVRRVREFVDEYEFADGRKVCLISDGRLMNLAAGQGHPAEIMDMSFAVQALSLEYLVNGYEGTPLAVNRYYVVSFSWHRHLSSIITSLLLDKSTHFSSTTFDKLSKMFYHRDINYKAR